MTTEESVTAECASVPLYIISDSTELFLIKSAMEYYIDSCRVCFMWHSKQYISLSLLDRASSW